MVTKAIGYKSIYGTYKDVTKDFKDESHFNNWFDYMTRRGYKIITIINLD